MPYMKLLRSSEIVEVKIHDRDFSRPLRKRGSRLGTWTNDFYQDKSLVSFTTEAGERHMCWMKTKRIMRERPNEME